MRKDKDPKNAPADLVGHVVRAPTKSNPLSVHWLTVIEQSEDGRFLKLGSGTASGRPYWVGRSQITDWNKKKASV